MNNLAETRQRHYGLDLLRIVSMLMIVLLHLLGPGGVMGGLSKGSINVHLVRFLDFATLGATNCYAMLSGYFGIGRRKRFASIASIWLQVFFYSVGITLVGRLAFGASLSLKEALFPVATKQYWYFTAYFVVFLLSPVLNAALDKLSLRQLAAMLLTVGAVFCSSPFLGDIFILNGGYSTHWMVYLYLLGGFLRRLNISSRPWKWAVLYLIMVLMNVGAQWLALKLCWKDYSLLKHYNNPLLLLASICLFMTFASWKIKGGLSTRLIAIVAPLSFGVYLIHTNLYPFSLLSGRFVEIGSKPPVMMVLLLLRKTFVIFVICAVIDWLRLQLFRLLRIKPLLEKLGDGLDILWRKLTRKLDSND